MTTSGKLRTPKHWLTKVMVSSADNGSNRMRNVLALAKIWSYSGMRCVVGRETSTTMTLRMRSSTSVSNTHEAVSIHWASSSTNSLGERATESCNRRNSKRTVLSARICPSIWAVVSLSGTSRSKTELSRGANSSKSSSISSRSRTCCRRASKSVISDKSSIWLKMPRHAW